jgi:predicted molibdopterin-dependent oxidoreductase YjgC
MHPDDAAALGLASGEEAELTSRRGRVSVAVEPTDRVAPGELFMTFHFPETLANALTSDATDEVTDCPEYKVTAVSVTRSSAPRSA